MNVDLQNDLRACTPLYWVLNLLQVHYVLYRLRFGHIFWSILFLAHETGLNMFLFLFIQFPAAFAVFFYECIKLYKESKRRRLVGNQESICEANIQWTATNLALCALCGIIGGTVGGLLGSGGGFILGPLLLEIGVIPQVLSILI